jgi:hypothetical protein
MLPHRLVRRLAVTSTAAIASVLVITAAPTGGWSFRSQDDVRVAGVANAVHVVPLTDAELDTFNSFRTQNGLMSLAVAPWLEAHANDWAESVGGTLSYGDTTPITPSGSTWTNMSRRSELRGTVGEALAAMWDDQSGSLRNPALTHVGAVRVNTPDGVLVVVQVGTLTD